ncbi:MAG: hypothetical protein HC901_04605 [Bdellovibrionaceae bacterium]|nr:hypothetical protein [Pseudobdellovibrionaceae bacterium]
MREEMDNPHTEASRERPVPILIETAPAARPQRRDGRRLRIQERRARNRFLVLCAVLVVLLLLLYRVVT